MADLVLYSDLQIIVQKLSSKNFAFFFFTTSRFIYLPLMCWIHEGLCLINLSMIKYFDGDFNQQELKNVYQTWRKNRSPKNYMMYSQIQHNTGISSFVSIFHQNNIISSQHEHGTNSGHVIKFLTYFSWNNVKLLLKTSTHQYNLWNIRF